MVNIESDDKWKFVDEKSSYKVKSYPKTNYRFKSGTGETGYSN